MARTVRYAKLETRESRCKLKREKRHFSPVAENAALVYRHGQRAGSSAWQVRVNLGTTYRFSKIGVPDDYQDADGTRILDYWQAADRAREVAAAAGRGQRIGEIEKIPAQMTVADAFELYFAHREAKSGKAAVRTDRGKYENYIAPKFAAVLVSDLSHRTIQRWLQSGIGDVDPDLDDDEQADELRKMQATANRRLSVLKAGLTFAWTGSADIARQWQSVKPFPNTGAPPQPWLESQADARRLLRKIPAEFRPMAEAALLTGIRYGEARKLRAGDVNLKAGVVTVRNVANRKSNKTRHIPLTDEGVKFFEAHTAGKKSVELVFTRANGGPWKHGDQVRPMTEANEAAEIEPVVGFHGLRRTYGSWLAMAGAPMTTIQAVLGHASVTTTEKHYGFLTPDHIADSIRKHLPKMGVKTNVRQLRAAS